jgi:hypothetical protein
MRKVQSSYLNLYFEKTVVKKDGKGCELKNMYIPMNKCGKDNPEMRDIVVEWKNGIVKGFKSIEEAERYINNVCKKAAPDMDFSISTDLIQR